jgi:CubicO group peptidase (beta-lactamase class C family)
MMTAGMSRDNIAGGAYVLVSGGRIVASRGFGVSDVSSRKRVHPDSTVFGLASTTKLFTAIAAVRMSREGRIDLDAPVAPYLGTSAIASRVEGATVSRLLTHTAGYDDPTIGSGARAAEDVIPLARYLDRMLTSPWLPPQTQTSYSNVGVALAGHVLALASGTPFPLLLDSTVFIPFGMQRTTVHQPLPLAIERARSFPYVFSDGRQVLVPRIFFNDAPASAAYSTPHDMGVLMTRLLAPPTAEDSAIAASLFSRRFTNHPALAGMTLGFRESGDREGVYEHGGDWQDYSNALYLDRPSGTGLFVVFSGAEGGQTATDLWSMVLKSLPAKPARYAFSQPTQAGPGPGCSSVEGSYRDTRMSRHSIAKLGVLTGDVPELTVRGSPNGLELNGRSYREIGGGVFKADNGRTIAFRCENGGETTHLFRGNAAASGYRRIDPGEKRSVQLGLLLFALVAAIVAIVVDVKRRHSRNELSDVMARALRVAASVSAVLLFLALAFFLVSTNPWEFQYGMPSSIANLQRLSWLPVALAPLALVVTLGALIRAKASAGVIEVLLAVPAVLLVILMVQWNLISL